MKITLQPPTYPARLTTPNKGWIINKNTDRAAQTPQWRPGDSPGWNVINLMAPYLPESSSERLAPGDDTDVDVTVWIRYQDNSCSAQPSTGALATLSHYWALSSHLVTIISPPVSLCSQSAHWLPGPASLSAWIHLNYSTFLSLVHSSRALDNPSPRVMCYVALCLAKYFLWQFKTGLTRLKQRLKTGPSSNHDHIEVTQNLILSKCLT